MAISPLALGIGLQGKYDYRQQAALEMSRAKGRAKAEADAEAGKEKKRAEIRKMIVNIRPQGLLPFQQKIIDDNVADALNYASENQDDFSGVTQRVFEIESRSKAYRDQAEGYKRLSLQQGGMPADAQALRIVGTLSDPKEIQTELAKYGPATSVALTGDQLTLDNPKYTSTGESVAKSINSMQFELLEGAPVITVGDKKFAGVDINKNVPALITANIMSDANRKKSAINDYLQFSIDNDIPYDFSTPESTNEFLKNTTAWVQKKAQTDVDTRSKELNVTPSKGINFTYNAPGVEDVNRINPAGGGDIILKYKRFSKNPQTATPLGNVAVGNYNALLTNNTRMIDVNTGDNINKAQVVDTDFNEMKIFYVLNKDYEDLPAGLIVPNGFVDKAIEMGVVEPKILVFGKQKGSSGKSVYFSIDNVALSQMMKTTPKDRPAIEELQNTLENKRKEIEAKLPKKGGTPVAPKKATTPPAKAQPAQAKAKPAATTKQKEEPKEKATKPTKRTDPSSHGLKKF
jgi:hypothetical protein